MLREMRRQDRQLSEDETLEIIAGGEYGVLCTGCEDSMPYGVPISYAYDPERKVIYMHCSADGGQKLDNLRVNNKVCFTIVVNTELMPEKFATKYWSANVFGTVSILNDVEEKHRGMEAILRKYAVDFEEKGLRYIDAAINKVSVLRLDIAFMMGKARKL